MEAPRAHTADFFLVVTLQGKHSGNADSIKNVGQPWAGGMYGQPVLRCLPDTVKEGFRPTPSRLTTEGRRFKSCPAARKEKPLRWMS